MKKAFLLITVVFATLILSVSCDNSSADNKTTKKEKKERIQEIKNLEDFTQFKNHAELEEYFGKENVDSTVYYLAEGTERYLVSIVNPDKNNKIVIYWRQKTGDWKGLEAVEAVYSSFDSDYEVTTDEGTVYPIKCGLFSGSTLQDLEDENGAPVNFYGLCWDYGGSVFDLNENLYGYIFTIGCPEMETSEESSKEFLNIQGDKMFKSDDEAAKLCDLRIVSIKYSVR